MMEIYFINDNLELFKRKLVTAFYPCFRFNSKIVAIWLVISPGNNIQISEVKKDLVVVIYLQITLTKSRDFIAPDEYFIINISSEMLETRTLYNPKLI